MQRRASPRLTPLLGRPWAWFGAQLKWAPLASLFFTASIYAIRHAVYGALGLVYTHDPWFDLLVYESAKFAIFACLWLGVIFSVDSHAHWQAQRERLLVLQQSLSQARLAQLSAQLRPHFFFNALNTISALMHVDVARADRLLATLGELLRESLRSAPEQLLPLRRELHLLGLYSQVMVERFADRVTIEWHIEAAAQEAMVPALLLQPLLENAFKHGVETNRGPVRIRIAADLVGDELRLVVANTGDLLGATQEGIGLRNCRERLNELYGGSAELRLVAEAGEVRAGVRLPFTRSTA
jgi:LytS/YehU family sensor histidine kinase